MRRIAALIAMFLVTILLLAGIFSSVHAIRNADAERRYHKRLSEATAYCESLFDESTKVYEEVELEELSDCKERLEQLDSAEQNVAILREYVEDALSYRAWAEDADKFTDENNIVLSSFSAEDLATLDASLKSLAEPYQPLATEKFKQLEAEYGVMKAAADAVSALFETADFATIRSDVDRQAYNDAKEKVDSLKQEDLKESYQKPLEDVLAAVEKAEQIARERAEAARRAEEERQRQIAASWVRLDLSPYYINQHSAGVDNGCEAAALLMALKYKGYIRGMDFRSFALNMPMSSDPNQGFYQSITDLEPREEAHWIAPAPLAVYGASTSGAAVANASGYSLDRLDQEVANGNPVVIYLTYHFNNPKEYSKGVPKNLHVLVLSGYNSYTGDQQFYDPWPAAGPSVTLSKARTEYLYAASGYRAVVVR